MSADFPAGSLNHFGDPPLRQFFQRQPESPAALFLVSVKFHAYVVSNPDERVRNSDMCQGKLSAFFTKFT